jgi:hypothetical protein
VTDEEREVFLRRVFIDVYPERGAPPGLVHTFDEQHSSPMSMAERILAALTRRMA